MIISELNLESFAGFTNKKISFDTGLNVIYGVNESGKSTIFKAIFSILYVNSKLTKKKFESLMQPFVPLGGDISKASLTFLIENKEYIIEKLWENKNKENVLFTNDDKSLVKDEVEVNSIIENLFQVKEGVFKSVLMTDLFNLENTLAILKDKKNSTMESLNDLLQKSILNLDEVSISKFQKLLDSKEAEYFSHWDVNIWGPENNRGVKNPYKNDVGKILRAYYLKEQLELDLENTIFVEDELDRINLLYNTANNQLEEIKEFLEKNKSLEKEISKYNELFAKQERIDMEILNLKQVVKDWPVLENNLIRHEKDIIENQKKIEVILEEEKIAKKIESEKSFRIRFDKLSKAKEKYDTIKLELDKLLKIDKKDIQELQKIINSQNQIRVSLQSGQISVQVKAKNDLNIEYKKDVSIKEEKFLQNNEKLNIDANARILLFLENIDVSIDSGIENFEELEAKSGILEKEFSSLLKELKVNNIDEAIQKNIIFEEKSKEYDFAKKIYLDELQEDDFNELQIKYKKLSSHEITPRQMEVIIQEKLEVQNNIRQIELEIKKTKNILADYEEKYQNQDNLFNIIIDKKNKLNIISKEINSMSELPAEFNSREEFLKSYEDKEIQKDKLLEEKNDLLIEKDKIDKIDISVEELEKQLLEANDEYEKISQEAKSILKIQEVSKALISKNTDSIFGELEERFKDYSFVIFEDRYKSINLVDGLPKEFLRGDKIFPFELLSLGAKNAFALAVRLVMAELFLKEFKGFIILDDPLVNLDAKRFKNAASVIQKFAQNKQVLYFTCHKNQADVLGGNLITV